MDKDKVKVILKEAIAKTFDEEEVDDNREGYIGEATINLMAEAALNVLLAVEDVQKYLKDEGLLKE